MSHPGVLKIYLGPMFSQNTQTLLNDLEMLVRSNCPALYVCHVSDTRCDVAARADGVTTHKAGFSQLPAGVEARSVARLADIGDDDLARFVGIGVDESQFFEDLDAVVPRWVNALRKHVIVAGLDGDAFMRPFGKTLQLIPLADKVKKLRAKCSRCRDELEAGGFRGDPSTNAAPFTLRLSGGSEQTLVGGASMYVAVCRNHHHA